MGGLPKVRLEMPRHQERAAQSSAAPRMQDALTALEPLNGRIAPTTAVPIEQRRSSRADIPLPDVLGCTGSKTAVRSHALKGCAAAVS